MKRYFLPIIACGALLISACTEVYVTVEAPANPVPTLPSEDPIVPSPDAYSPSDVPVVAQLPAGAQAASVNFVVDGDTIEVNIDGQDYRVRYIGIDTPERDETCYLEATSANAAYVQDQPVYLVKDVSETDRFDRLLRYIYVEVDGGFVLVNEALVVQGYARSAEFPPDTSFADIFNAAEGDASNNSEGCWQVPGFNGF